MNTSSRLFLKPITWSSVNPRASSTTRYLSPSIQIFGYTSDGRTAYVRIPRNSTFILKFDQIVDQEMVSNVSDILNPSYIKPSCVDNKIMIIRAPELSPIELTANPDFEGLATWIDAKQDPYGEVESFWEAKSIKPYNWISINKYTPIPGKYTNCDLNINSDEEHISEYVGDTLPNITPRLFFWDIETFASRQGEFPNSSNVDDYIALISIITMNRDGTKGYVIARGDVNRELLTKHNNMVLIHAKDEKDLLTKFFAIYNTFQPDRQIYYNGDMFDMPYLLNRLAINNIEIPKISKIRTLTPWVIRRSYPTPFGREYERTINIPGTEIIDLIHFYRRFYPHLKNHKLDTVSKFFIGEGKTGLTIDDMMDAIRTNNPDLLAKVVDYSYVDSLRMSELWLSSNTQHVLDSVCNNMCVSADSLLRSHFEDIINKLLFNIDPGTAVFNNAFGTPDHLKDAVQGIYRNVHVYDYSELYRQIMIMSDHPVSVELANRLDGAPHKLILTAFYSSYVDKSIASPLLTTMLESVLESNMIIALEPFIIRSIGPLNADWLKQIAISSCYVSVAKASYIILNESGELEPAGLSKLCRPKFSLASDIIKQYLTLVYSDNLSSFTNPVMSDLPVDKFIMTERVGDISLLEPNTIKHKLALQYGSNIETWVSMQYVMTSNGPTLLSKLKDNDVIDYTYYTKELQKYIIDLQSLKLYGK